MKNNTDTTYINFINKPSSTREPSVISYLDSVKSIIKENVDNLLLQSLDNNSLFFNYLLNEALFEDEVPLTHNMSTKSPFVNASQFYRWLIYLENIESSNTDDIVPDYDDISGTYFPIPYTSLNNKQKSLAHRLKKTIEQWCNIGYIYISKLLLLELIVIKDGTSDKTTSPLEIASSIVKQLIRDGYAIDTSREKYSEKQKLIKIIDSYNQPSIFNILHTNEASYPLSSNDSIAIICSLSALPMISS